MAPLRGVVPVFGSCASVYKTFTVGGHRSSDLIARRSARAAIISCRSASWIDVTTSSLLGAEEGRRQRGDAFAVALDRVRHHRQLGGGAGSVLSAGLSHVGRVRTNWFRGHDASSLASPR